MSATSSCSFTSSSTDEFEYGGRTLSYEDRDGAHQRQLKRRGPIGESSFEHQLRRRRQNEPPSNIVNEGYGSMGSSFTSQSEPPSRRLPTSERRHRTERRCDATGALTARRAAVSARAVTPRERDMIIYRLQRQVEAAHLLSSSCTTDSDDDRSSSPLSTESSSSSMRGAPSRGRFHAGACEDAASTASDKGGQGHVGIFTPRGVDVWATPVDDEGEELVNAVPTVPLQRTPLRTRRSYHGDPQADAPRTTVVECSEPYSTFGSSVIRIGDPKQKMDAPSCRAVVRSYAQSNPQRQQSRDTQPPPRMRQRMDPEADRRCSGSPLVLQFVDHSDILVEAAKEGDDQRRPGNKGRHRGMDDGDEAVGGVTTSSAQTDSAVQAALSVAKQLLRCETAAQTPSLLPPVSRLSATPSNRSLSALTDAANGQDEATTTDGLSRSPIAVTVHVDTGSQCDAVAEKRMASRSTETMPKELRSKGVNAEVSHSNAGVATTQCSTSARGTSPPSEAAPVANQSDVSAIAAHGRDVTPSPTRTPPLPTPQRHHPYAFVSPVAMRNLSSNPSANKPRKAFAGTITPLGRRTPTREHHHVNSPVQARGVTEEQRRQSPERSGDRTEGLDRRIALKCVKFAVFSDFSRCLDFKGKMSMTLREARELYDAMSETDLWGHTGVYRQLMGRAAEEPSFDNTRIDVLVQGAMSEVVGGACLEWSTWFAGVSRRRVEEALARFSDIFPSTTSKYVIDGSSGGVLMRVPVSRVEAVASVLF